MPDMKPKFPLRERRKQIIRDSLTDAALKLFGERGYINVTLEEVAEKAVVHVQTVYKYFKTKENLALAVAIDGHDIVRKLIQNPNRTEEVSSVWRNHALARLPNSTPCRKNQCFFKLAQ